MPLSPLLEAPGRARQLLSLGAPLPMRYKKILLERLPGRFHEHYGPTEGLMTVLDRD